LNIKSRAMRNNYTQAQKIKENLNLLKK